MRVITKEEFQVNVNRGIISLHNGVFIHPTDTIYGLGCNATDTDSVKKLREIKERKNAPFSVIVPSKEWVRENCFVNEEGEKWLNKLPGPYTLLFKLKNPDAVSPYVNPGLITLGVRIPDHWFTKAVASHNIPIVTTSANKKNGNFMTSIDDLDPDIKKLVSFIIYEDEKIGTQSKIIDLTQNNIKIIKR